MPRQSPEARRQYYLENRERIREQSRRRYILNREQILADTKAVAERNRDFRKKLLSEFSCICCGESDSDLIDWHHLDESTKKFNVGHTSRALGEWWDEVLKCVALCALCHRKLHKNKLCLIPHKR